MVDVVLGSGAPYVASAHERDGWPQMPRHEDGLSLPLAPDGGKIGATAPHVTQFTGWIAGAMRLESGLEGCAKQSPSDCLLAACQPTYAQSDPVVDKCL